MIASEALIDIKGLVTEIWNGVSNEIQNTEELRTKSGKKTGDDHIFYSGEELVGISSASY